MAADDEKPSSPANGGGEPPAPTLDEVLTSAVLAFAPHLTAEQAYALVTAEVGLESRLQVVFRDAILPEPQEQYPNWGYRVTRRGEPSWQGVVVAPKAIAKATSPEEITQATQVIAYLTSPVARAVLRAHGYDITFIQAPGAATKSKLIVT